MRIPPHLPSPWFRKAENKADQKVTRIVSFAGNVNALAASICILLALKFWPNHWLSIIYWAQASGVVVLSYCAFQYAWRAYEYYLDDYTQRCSFVDANDKSKTVQGADSGISGLAELKAAGMIGNANERIIGTLEGVPINTPQGTTFCKYSGMQGSQKTIGFVIPNLLHMANTVAHFTSDHDHQFTEIETEDGEDWEDAIDEAELAAFDAAQTAPIDPFAIEGELFHDDDRYQ